MKDAIQELQELKDEIEGIRERFSLAYEASLQDCKEKYSLVLKELAEKSDVIEKMYEHQLKLIKDNARQKQ